MFYRTFKPEAGGVSPEKCHLGSTKFDQLKGLGFPDCQPKNYLNPLVPTSFNSTWRSWIETTQLLKRRPFYRVSRFLFPTMADLSSSKVSLSMRKGRKGWMMLSFLGAPRCFRTVDVLDCLFLVEWRLDFHVFLFVFFVSFQSVGAIQSKNLPTTNRRRDDERSEWVGGLRRDPYQIYSVCLCLIILVKLGVATSQ